MRAARLVAPGVFDLVELPDPEPGPGEVLVHMRAASICGSDLHRVFRGDDVTAYPLPPGAPGHEGIGTVLASASSRWRHGDVVLTVPMPGAGGCFATHQVVHEDFLVAVPAGADLDRALLAQQLGTVVYGFRRYWPAGTPAEGLVAGVIGAGSAGLFALQLCRLAGFAEVIVSDLELGRLALARELGATVTCHAPGESFVEAVLEASAGRGAALVVEAAGLDACRADAVAALARFGRLGCFGLPERPGLVGFPFAEAFRKACTIELAGNAQLEPGLSSFAEALELIVSGRIEVGGLLGEPFPLGALTEAFALAHRRGAPKVAIDPSR